MFPASYAALAAVAERNKCAPAFSCRDDRVRQRETVLRCDQSVIFACQLAKVVRRLDDRPVDGRHAHVVVSPVFAGCDVQETLVLRRLQNSRIA